jgi:signal transduction histidine kinase
MSRLSRIILGYLVSFLFIVIPAKAQKEASSLYAYYQRCQERLLEPVVLSMSDTLFRMATGQNDQRMQAVALSTRLDYYYYQANNEDSIVFYTNKVKQFAKEIQQSKYYYFAWANRLILYYLKTGRSNIALYEAEKVLKEAQAEDNKTGLMYCYNIMSQIYTIKNFDLMASEWRVKEIELTEKYKLENYNISNTYAQLANYYTMHHQPELALEALGKAVKTANSASHKILAKLTYVEYYSEFGDFPAAEKILKECRELFDQDKRLDSLKKRFYRTEAFYYQRSKQFAKALEAAEKQKAEEQRLNEYAMSSEQYRLKGEIYRQMGRPDEAVKFLKKYIEADDSLKIANEQLASSEFATLLNVEKLNTEKKELMLRTKEKELSNKTTLIFSLIILLAILFLFLYRESRLNRKLKASESELRNKNEELTYSREELRKARDQAEATSQMKTTFIQSMSHEIRTPLNSIIGFSQVLSDHYGNEETKEFVNIIKANTDDLLRLVTDVLALSELDQYNKLPTNIQTDINMICQLSIEVAKMQKQDTVEFLFKPEREKLIILSNPERISQLLANLAHNAIKFTTHGSIELTYSVLEAENKLEISVTDTGIGIPKEKQEKVFERFYKMNSFSQGTGLGLSISRTIAEKLGGSLHIDSSYTDGCRMVLTLPLVYVE